MIRLIVSAIVHLIANAVALLIASLLLDGFSINAISFIAAVLIFTVVEVLAGPLLLKIALTNIPALAGGIALVTTLVGLIVTDLISDGLSISGLSTWLLATLIVWLGGLLAGLLLPLVIFKKTLEHHKDKH